MKAEMVRCPACNAPLRVPVGQAVVVCEFCHASVRCDEPEPVLAEAGPRLAEAISLKASADFIVPLLESGTGLPATRRERLSTSKDDQDALHVDLVAGNDPKPERNRALASLVLPIKKRGSRGVPVLELLVSVETGGQVRVAVCEPASDNEVAREGLSVAVVGQRPG
jgi:hypothetical protein